MMLAQQNALEGRPLRLSTRDTALFSALQLPSTLMADQLEPAILDIFEHYLHYSNQPPSPLRRKIGLFMQRLNRLRPGQLESSSRPELLGFVQGSTQESQAISLRLFWRRWGRRKKEKEQEAHFGRLILSAEQRHQWETACCVQGHRGLRLWLTDGQKPASRFSAGAHAQMLGLISEMHMEKLRRHAAQYQHAIRQLEQKIAQVLPASPGGDWTVGRAGRLAGHLAWKSVLPEETQIFLRRAEDAAPSDLKALRQGRWRFTDYAGTPAMEDALAGLRPLQRSMHVCAILNGSRPSTEQARRMFGTHFLRIQSPEQLASAGARFVQQEIARITQVT